MVSPCVCLSETSWRVKSSYDILSDVEDSEDVYSSKMMRKEVSVLLSSLVCMVKIYQPDNSSIVQVPMPCLYNGKILFYVCTVQGF